MKYVIIADLHLQISGFSVLVDGIPDRIYFPLKNLRKAIDIAKQHNAVLIIAGDLIEEKDKIHQVVLDYTFQALNECKQEVQTYIVMGNHDYTVYKDKQFSYLDYVGIPLAKSKEPIFFDDIALIGHSHNKEDIIEDFRNVDPETTKLIVSHFGLQEALVGNTKYKGGEFSVRDLQHSFPNTTIILGHYHKPQTVTENILYVGSPTPVRIDERDDEKRILLVDTDTNEIISIPTEYPKIHTIELSKDSRLDISELEKNITENYHKYVLKIPSSHIQFKEIMDLEKHYKGYVYTYRTQNIQEPQNIPTNLDISEINIKSIQDEFLEKMGIPKEQHIIYKNEIEDLL